MKLTELSKIIKGKNSLPILDTILIDSNTITGTDLETFIIQNHNLNVQGTGCVDFKKFKSILAKLKTIDLISFSENKVDLIKGKIKLSLETIDKDEFPKTPTSFNKIGTFNFDDKFKKAQKFVSKDELRPGLTGILIDSEYIVSTDAYKLCFIKHNQSISQDLLLPQSTFFVNGLYEVATNSDGWVQLVNDDMTVISRLIDDNYPNYKAVIPNDNPIKIAVGKKSFKEAIEVALLTANTTTNKVTLNTETKELSSEDLDYNTESKCGLDIDKLQGDDLVISFNGKYMLDVINSIGIDNIIIEMSLPNSAIILNSEILLMPLLK